MPRLNVEFIFECCRCDIQMLTCPWTALEPSNGAGLVGIAFQLLRSRLGHYHVYSPDTQRAVGIAPGSPWTKIAAFFPCLKKCNLYIVRVNLVRFARRA